MWPPILFTSTFVPSVQISVLYYLKNVIVDTPQKGFMNHLPGTTYFKNCDFGELFKRLCTCLVPTEQVLSKGEHNIIKYVPWLLSGKSAREAYVRNTHRHGNHG